MSGPSASHRGTSVGATTSIPAAARPTGSTCTGRVRRNRSTRRRWRSGSPPETSFGRRRCGIPVAATPSIRRPRMLRSRDRASARSRRARRWVARRRRRPPPPSHRIWCHRRPGSGRRGPLALAGASGGLGTRVAGGRDRHLLVLPAPVRRHISKVGSSVRDMTWLEVTTLVVAAGWNLATYLFVMLATMPGLTYSQAFVVAESSTAVANTVPAGGAIGIATSFGMFHSWGFSRSRISVSLLLTGIWNNFAKLSLPVLALALIALQGNPSTGRLIAGLTGIAALIGAITVFALVLRSDAWAQRVGDGLARWVSALQRPLGRKPVEGWGKATRKFRSRTILLLRSRWHCADPGHPGQSPVAVPGVAAGATAHRRVQPGGELGRGAGRLRLRPVGHRDSDHPGRHRHRGGSADRRAVGCRGRAAAGGRRRPGLPGADLRAAHPAGVGGVRVLAAQLLLAAGTERRPPDRARPRVGMKPAAAAAAVTTRDPAHRPGAAAPARAGRQPAPGRFDRCRRRGGGPGAERAAGTRQPRIRPGAVGLPLGQQRGRRTVRDRLAGHAAGQHRRRTGRRGCGPGHPAGATGRQHPDRRRTGLRAGQGRQATSRPRPAAGAAARRAYPRHGGPGTRVRVRARRCGGAAADGRGAIPRSPGAVGGRHPGGGSLPGAALRRRPSAARRGRWSGTRRGGRRRNAAGVRSAGPVLTNHAMLTNHRRALVCCLSGAALIGVLLAVSGPKGALQQLDDRVYRVTATIRIAPLTRAAKAFD